MNHVWLTSYQLVHLFSLSDKFGSFPKFCFGFMVIIACSCNKHSSGTGHEVMPRRLEQGRANILACGPKIFKFVDWPDEHKNAIICNDVIAPIENMTHK